MKRIISAALTAAMLLSGAATVFAEEPAAGLTLAEGSRLVLNTEKGYVDKIDGTITVGELKANFAGEVTVAGKADDAAVATDDVITAGETSMKALIYGDVDRNGKINLIDASSVLKYIAKWDTDINLDAADVDKSDAVNLVDVTKLLKAIANWADISLGNVRMVFENKKQTAENDDATLQIFFTSIMNKIGRTETANTGEHAYKMKLAKNEAESCQAMMLSTERKEGLTAELTEFVSEFGDATLESKLEWVYYYDTAVFTQVNPWYNDRNNDSVKNDEFPEVLMPMADSFELTADRLQHLVITVTSTADSPAGMYKAALNIKDAEGKIIKTADVYAYVYDFTVPDAPYSASLFATAQYPTETHPNSYFEYFDHMLGMNLSSYTLPVEITDERADAYMSDPRVTAFVIAGGVTGDNGEFGQDMYGGSMNKTPEQTKANYEKVASNPDWFRKGLFYYTDEPTNGGLFKVRDAYNYVTELLGTTNIRNMTPFGQSYPDTEHQNKGIDSVEFIKDYINVWVPTSDAYHRLAEGGKWSPRRIIQLYGEYPDRIEEMRARGDDIWWYVCVSPEVPYANYFTCYQGVITRVLSWQQYFNNVNGVLYYATSMGWNSITKYQFNIGNGDGTLQYPGEKWGFEGPQASWRLLQIRDGFDDFDYLRMAEELVGREKVMDAVKKTTTGMLAYTEDYRVLEAARDEIIEMIVEAQA